MSETLREVEELAKTPVGRRVLQKAFLENAEHMTSWDEYCKCVEIAKRRVNTRKLRNESNSIRKRTVENAGECEVCGFGYVPVLHMHHVVPFKLGGDNSKDNLVVVCPNCHKLLHASYKYALSDDIRNLSGLFLYIRKQNGEVKYKRFVGIFNRFISHFDDGESE